jgi:osmotically-inducible protein OsmY
MKARTRILALAVLAGASLVTAGCSVMRGQETVGSYVDDKTIVASIKAKMIEDKSVDAAAISVQSLNGEVSLSGFAKSGREKAHAETIARTTRGVRAVHDNLVVRP